MKLHIAVALLVGITLTPIASFADTRFQGQAVRVLDGDTIEVLSGSNRNIRVRLANIDAPEKSQPFGQKSKQHLTALVAGKTVEVVDLGGDQYGRRIGRVLVDGREANVEQVRSGLAWVYSRYNHDGQLPSLENSARSQRLGLWVDPNPQAPWEFRRVRK
ncbi:Endonuclease YhcR precursor [compost metagenome]